MPYDISTREVITTSPQVTRGTVDSAPGEAARGIKRLHSGARTVQACLEDLQRPQPVLGGKSRPTGAEGVA